MKKKIKIFLIIFKVVLTVFLGIYIFKFIDIGEAVILIKKSNLSFLGFAFLLLGLNIFLQFKRWQYLVKKLDPTVLPMQILKSVFIGITLGILTPGRAGEIGKLFFIPQVDKLKLLGSGITEKLYDVFPVVIFGLLSIPLLPHLFFTGMIFNRIIGVLFFLIISVIILYVALNPSFIKVLLEYIDRKLFKKKKRFEKFIYAFESLTRNDALKILGYTTILYITYTSQMVFLAKSFGSIGFYEAFLAVWATILIKTLLPISIGDLGIREGAAAFAFGLFLYSKEAAVSAALFLFIINLFLPALIGLLIILFGKFRFNNDE